MKKIGLGKLTAISFVLTHVTAVIAEFLDEGSMGYQAMYYLGIVCFVATLGLGVTYLLRCWKAWRGDARKIVVDISASNRRIHTLS